VWSRVEDVPDIRIGGAANVSDLPVPVLRQSMDVNALNFCKFSLLESTGDGNSRGGALVALPNLVESSLVSHCDGDGDASASGVMLTLCVRASQGRHLVTAVRRKSTCGDWDASRNEKYAVLRC
jgi:hypothetical protein